jgi:hypothetical protein
MCHDRLSAAGGAAQAGQDADGGDGAASGAAAQQESEGQAELRRWYTDRVGGVLQLTCHPCHAMPHHAVQAVHSTNGPRQCGQTPLLVTCCSFSSHSSLLSATPMLFCTLQAGYLPPPQMGPVKPTYIKGKQPHTWITMLPASRANTPSWHALALITSGSLPQIISRVVTHPLTRACMTPSHCCFTHEQMTALRSLDVCAMFALLCC